MELSRFVRGVLCWKAEGSVLLIGSLLSRKLTLQVNFSCEIRGVALWDFCEGFFEGVSYY